MSDLNERIAAEFENIEQVLGELPSADSCPGLSVLELAGAAALLQNFYNGIENVLKQVMISEGAEIPTGPSWHRDFINWACSQGVVSERTGEELRRYLAFRHFFTHGYAFDLSADRISPLVNDAKKIFARFKSDTERWHTHRH